MNPIIETERIILRKFTIDDYKAVFEFNSNLEVQKYTGDEILKSEERAKEIITDVSLKDYELYGYGRFAAFHKADNRVIGFAGLKYLPEFDETDIGFRFLPEYWGKGIGTEVSKELVKYAFDTLGLQKIIGIAMPENIGSCKILEKVGLTLYKTGDYDGDNGFYNWYSIDRKEYQEIYKKDK